MLLYCDLSFFLLSFSFSFLFFLSFFHSLPSSSSSIYSHATAYILAALPGLSQWCRPLHIPRKKRKYFQKLFSSKAVDTMLRKNLVKFGVNVDLATYRDGVRETHNPPGRAHAGTVWSAFEEGASVRILNPQTFHTPLHQM